MKKKVFLYFIFILVYLLAAISIAYGADCIPACTGGAACVDGKCKWVCSNSGSGVIDTDSDAVCDEFDRCRTGSVPPVDIDGCDCDQKTDRDCGFKFGIGAKCCFGETCTQAVCHHGTVGGNADNGFLRIKADQVWGFYGPIKVRITGPSYPNGEERLVSTLSDLPVQPGTYTAQYVSNGPQDTLFTSIAEPATQTVSAGGTISYTFKYSGVPPYSEVPFFIKIRKPTEDPYRYENHAWIYRGGEFIIHVAGSRIRNGITFDLYDKDGKTIMSTIPAMKTGFSLDQACGRLSKGLFLLGEHVMPIFCHTAVDIPISSTFPPGDYFLQAKNPDGSKSNFVTLIVEEPGTHCNDQVFGVTLQTCAGPKKDEPTIEDISANGVVEPWAYVIGGKTYNIDVYGDFFIPDSKIVLSNNMIDCTLLGNPSSGEVIATQYISPGHLKSANPYTLLDNVADITSAICVKVKYPNGKASYHNSDFVVGNKRQGIDDFPQYSACPNAGPIGTKFTYCSNFEIPNNPKALITVGGSVLSPDPGWNTAFAAIVPVTKAGNCVEYTFKNIIEGADASGFGERKVNVVPGFYHFSMATGKETNQEFEIHRGAHQWTVEITGTGVVPCTGGTLPGGCTPANCQSPSTCVNNVCTPPGGTCTPANCQSPSTCVNNVCTLPGGGACICPSGQTCNSAGTCVTSGGGACSPSNCPSPSTCVNNVCTPPSGTCSDSSHCIPPDTCQNGHCLPPSGGTCSPSNCPSPSTCVNNVCTPPGVNYNPVLSLDKTNIHNGEYVTVSVSGAKPGDHLNFDVVDSSGFKVVDNIQANGVVGSGGSWETTVYAHDWNIGTFKITATDSEISKQSNIVDFQILPSNNVPVFSVTQTFKNGDSIHASVSNADKDSSISLYVNDAKIPGELERTNNNGAWQVDTVITGVGIGSYDLRVGVGGALSNTVTVNIISPTPQLTVEPLNIQNGVTNIRLFVGNAAPNQPVKVKVMDSNGQSQIMPIGRTGNDGRLDVIDPNKANYPIGPYYITVYVGGEGGVPETSSNTENVYVQ